MLLSLFFVVGVVLLLLLLALLLFQFNGQVKQLGIYHHQNTPVVFYHGQGAPSQKCCIASMLCSHHHLQLTKIECL